MTNKNNLMEKEMAHYNQKQIWNEISLSESSKEVLLLFVKDIFNTSAFQNKHSNKVVNGFFLINFLGVPFPIGKCIIKCIKKTSSSDYIQLDQFIAIIEVFFIKDQSAKEDFFFKLLDFNKDGEIQLNDMMLFFKHLTFGMDISPEETTYVISHFFDSKLSMNYIDFKARTQQYNCLIVMFYYVIFTMKTFNDDALQYYKNNIVIAKQGTVSKCDKDSSGSIDLSPFNSNNGLRLRLNSQDESLQCGNEGIKRLSIHEVNHINSIDTTITNNENDDDIDILNAFEDDKVASFELIKLSPEFPKRMIDNTNSDINPFIHKNNNEMSNNINILLPNKEFINLNVPELIINDKQMKTEKKLKPNPNPKPYPYRLINNSKIPKLGIQSAQISLPKCFLLNNTNINKDSPSLYLEINNVASSSMGNIKLIIVANYLFVFYPKYNLNYCILLLSHSFINSNSDLSLTLYLSKEKEFKFTFSTKQSMQQFIAAFNAINKDNSIEQNYEIIEEISKSKYCKISLIRTKNDPKKKYCLKTLYNTNPFSKLFRWEAYIANYLSVNQNDYIIQFYDVYESPKKIQILMEYFSIKTLNSVTDKLTHPQCVEVVKQLTRAVDFLHINGIIHRDLKLENILYSTEDAKIKVIDFGLLKVLFPSDSTKKFCGSLAYLPPEIFRREQYNKEVDIWSVGIIAYLLEYKEYPFDIYQSNINQVYHELFRFLSKLASQKNDYWDENIIRKIIKLTLVIKPDERPTSALLLKLLF